MPSVRSLLATLALGLAAACKNVTPPGMFFDSSPPGAELLLDGRRTGYVTPCLVDLPAGETHRVQLELAGFQSRHLTLVPERRVDEVRWRSGSFSKNGMRAVFGLEAEDILLPYRVDNSLSPARVFLTLEPTDER